MSDDRWRRVRALFEAAVDRPPAERDAFLTAQSGDDDELRREVESLLASDGSGVLDRFPLAAAAVRDSNVFALSAAATHAEPALAPEDRLGPYEIVELMGTGAMGEVYRARDTTLNREVALKVLPSRFALDPDRLARFKREAQMLAALNHSNIAAIYGLEQSDGVQALVLELIDGPTLADRLGHGPLPMREALAIGRRIAEALEAAHEKGIIHRDLKPANIKVGAQTAVKVLDFGLAKVWEAAPQAHLAESPALTANDLGGRILGTPGYMSPEQARGRPLDKRADIWSFGCVLFEMVTGRPAFAGETISDTLAHVLERDPDWQALPHATPARLRDLLRRCVQKDVTWRLRDIGDARIELEEISRSLERPDEEARPTDLRDEPNRRPARIAAGVTIAAALALLAIAYVNERSRQAPPPAFRQLTFRHGTIGGARLAPDGQTVVYRATWIGAPPELFVLRPENPNAGAIGLVNAGLYSVSSTGDLAIAVGCRLNWGECLGTLATVPITGGSPREMKRDVLVADWSPDSRNIAVVSFTGSAFRLEYPIDRVLYEPAGWITSVRVSPGGDRVAFLDHDQLGDFGGSVAMVDVNGRKTTLSTGWKSLKGLAWSAAGHEVWFTGSRTGKGGSSTLHAVTLSGRERTVLSSPGTLQLNDISRDGARVLFTRGTTRGAITGVGADGATERDLSWLDYSTVADLSADGRTLLFYEWGEGVAARPTVFIRRTDGSEPVRLGEGRPLALSPDGRWVVAVRDNPPRQLVAMPTGTGEARVMARGPIVEYLEWAAWSADGRRIFFSARESPDVQRTYVQDVDGGEPRPVTPTGFVGLVLSPDGRTIVAVDRYGEYYLCSTESQSEPHPLDGYRDGDVPLQWSADARFLFVREDGNLALRIHKLNLATGARQFWKELEPRDPAVLVDIGSDPGQVRITRDGNSYAYTYWTFEGGLYLAQGLK